MKITTNEDRRVTILKVHGRIRYPWETDFLKSIVEVFLDKNRNALFILSVQAPKGGSSRDNENYYIGLSILGLADKAKEKNKLIAFARIPQAIMDKLKDITSPPLSPHKDIFQLIFDSEKEATDYIRSQWK